MNKNSDIQSLMANYFLHCPICKSKADFSIFNEKKAENLSEKYKQFLEFLAWKKARKK